MQNETASKLDLQRASDPSTVPDRLRELAATGDGNLRRTIAANPNTPPHLLWELGTEFPEVVSANPVLALLSLAEPNLAKEIPLAALRQLARHETLPVTLLAMAARRGDFHIEQALSANPQTPATILTDLAHHPTAGVREAAKLHVALAGELPASNAWQVLACQAAIARLRRGRAGQLALPHAPVLLLRWLAASDAPLLRETAARNPIAPPEILIQLARDPVVQVRLAVASNPATPAAALTALCDEERWSLRAALAANPQAPTALLADLARATITTLQAQVASASGQASVELLEKSWQPQWQILRAIAQNPGASCSLLERILATLQPLMPRQLPALKVFHRQYDRLCGRMAGHPEMPAERAACLFGPDLLACLLAPTETANTDIDLPFSMLREIAANPYTPPTVLVRLAHIGPVLRRAIAQNPALGIELCETLARDRDERVRLNLATNPATPTGLLASLLDDAAPAVRNAAIAPYLWRMPAELPRLLVDALATTPSDRRFIWLFHPQMPPAQLAKYARPLSWLERCAIAQNPSTPRPCLQQLARDGNQVVRGAARANLSGQSG